MKDDWGQGMPRWDLAKTALCAGSNHPSLSACTARVAPSWGLLLADAAMLGASALALGCIRKALLAVAAFRAGVVLNALLNEWGHVVVGLVRGSGRRALNGSNLLGGRPLLAHLLTLVPFAPDYRGDLVVRIRGLTLSDTRIVRQGGFWLASAASALTTVLSGALLSEAPAELGCGWLAYTVGSVVAVAGALLSDMTSLTGYAALPEVMACGNVTLLGRLARDETSAFPARIQKLFTAMTRISQMRGAQSGGAAIQVRCGDRPGQVIRKCINPKRGDLAGRLCRTLRGTVRGRPAFGASFVVQAHVRYATSGVSSKHEAHPFRFIEAAERGHRRIVRWAEGGPMVVEEPVETALTHNGDLDGLRFRGTRLAFPDVGYFLERVLRTPNRWVGDSPLVAACVELFLTQGMWLESLRLAFHLTVAPPPPDVSAVPVGLDGADRARAIRSMLAEYPAPSRADFARWARAAEEVLLLGGLERGSACPFSKTGASEAFRHELTGRLAARFDGDGFPELPPEQTLAFARAAVIAFLDNDLYVAVRKLEVILEGTFGCVVTSTLEPGRAIVLARGQPLSLGFQQSTGMVAVVSERAALKVSGADGRPAFDERLDLDLSAGEIARIEVGQEPIRVTLYNIASGRESTRERLQVSGRLVPLVDNPFVAPLPFEPPDRADTDVEDVVSILGRIRSAWQDPESGQAQTAGAFARALLASERPQLLVIGITNDLWLAEQFVKNLRTLFPRIQAEARSSNDVLKEQERTRIDENTVVLAVSQSGQDFPTLAALLFLRQRLASLGSRSCFVLTGEVDSLMGQAVGQHYARGARFCRKIFTNESGFRPSEAAVASVNATHHTFVELLLFLAERALDAREFRTPPHGCWLSLRDLAALSARRDLTVQRQAPCISGTLGSPSSADLSRALVRHARRWRWHVLEGIAAFGLVVLVLQLNFQFRLGLEPSGLLLYFAGPDGFSLPAGAWLEALAAQANVVFYAFLAPLFVWGFRLVQRRAPFHRQGTRELLIGDVGYVHQIVWLLAKKLFSLSYGFASIKPYSADNTDDLIMTHEPLRGTLALFGLPDAGREPLRQFGAAAMMTARQFANSRSLAGAGAEVLTISHSPTGPGNGSHGHLALPRAELLEASPELAELAENLFDSWERMLAMQVFLNRLARGVSKFGPFRYDRSRTKDQVFAPTTAAPVSAAALYELLARASECLVQFEPVSLPFDVVCSEWRLEPPSVRTLIGLPRRASEPAGSPPRGGSETKFPRIEVRPCIEVSAQREPAGAKRFSSQAPGQ